MVGRGAAGKGRWGVGVRVQRNPDWIRYEIGKIEGLGVAETGVMVLVRSGFRGWVGEIWRK